MRSSRPQGRGDKILLDSVPDIKNGAERVAAGIRAPIAIEKTFVPPPHDEL